MKVTKIYDLTNDVLNTTNDKVIIEMSLDEYNMLTGIIYLSKLYTDMRCLAEDCDKILKQLDRNTKYEYKE